jgi:hypothetical protein
MVLLTMTPGIVRALTKAEEASPVEFAELHRPNEPALAGAKPGDPVSHSQLIGLSKLLKKSAAQLRTDLSSHTEDATSETDNETIPTTLSALLLNTHIYSPPPPPP